MTDDLSALPEDVREALHRINRNFHISADYETILAYMLRLARENREWQTRCLQFQTERAKRAEAELAALKARIAEQPANPVDRSHEYVQSKEHGGCSECGYPEWEPWHRIAPTKVED